MEQQLKHHKRKKRWRAPLPQIQGCHQQQPREFLALRAVGLHPCRQLETISNSRKRNLEKVGEEGGAWTAQTHLSHYGFNADWGLMEVIEDACREIENQHNPADEGWRQYENPDETNPIIGWWVAPKVVDCKVLEVGCGVGIYVDALKKEAAKRNRQVFGVEPNLMGGTFDRFNGPKQLAVNILEQADPIEFANKVRRENLRDTGLTRTTSTSI